MVWCGDGREKELNGQLGVFGRACVHVCVCMCAYVLVIPSSKAVADKDQGLLQG